VNTPLTTNWKATTIAYDVQKALRRNRFVRNTPRSRTIANTTPSAAATV
jgi:hypothetical protein